MPLTALSLTTKLSWNLSRQNPDFMDTSSGVNSANWSLRGLSLGLWSQLGSYATLIPAGAEIYFDLNDLSNLLLEDFQLTRALGLLVMPVGGDIKMSEGSLSWFLSGEVTIPDGGVFLLSGPATSQGVPVSPACCTVEFWNPGVTDATVWLYVIGQIAQPMTGPVRLTGIGGAAHSP